MSDWAMKRFWTETSVSETEGGWAVTLDGRSIRTPAKAALILPTQAYAEAVAAEWEAQAEVVKPETMPVTRSANAAIDKVTVQFDEVAAMIAAYGETDLLCYRAESPDALVTRQAEAWDPLLDWAAETLGARLVPTQGIVHRPQDPQALARLHDETRALDPFALAAFHDLVALSGSLVIGFAAARGARAADALWQLSRVDEDWQAAQWGVDEEAAAQAALKRTDFLKAAEIFALLAKDRA